MEVMRDEEKEYYFLQDHPWLETADDSVDEEAMMIRFSLDEIRIS